jgi:hypothetical protein
MNLRHVLAMTLGFVVLGGAGVAVRRVSAEPASKPPSSKLPTAATAAPSAKLGDCDADRDGFRSIACGGNDCDDRDPLRFPGNVERCAGRLSDGRAAAEHDEDCDPCTVTASGASGDGDEDHDGIPSAACRNTRLGAEVPLGCDARYVGYDPRAGVVFGRDCDDNNPAVVVGSQVCDGPNAKICSISAATAGRYIPAACPAGTTCLAQPNALGICVR